MDPVTIFAVSAAASQVAGQGMSLSAYIFDVASKIKKAPQLMEDAALQVQLSAEALERLASILENMEGALTNDYFKHAMLVVEKCRDIYSEMKLRISGNENHKPGDWKVRVKWAFKNDAKIAKLKDELRVWEEVLLRHLRLPEFVRVYDFLPQHLPFARAALINSARSRRDQYLGAYFEQQRRLSYFGANNDDGDSSANDIRGAIGHGQKPRGNKSDKKTQGKRPEHGVISEDDGEAARNVLLQPLPVKKPPPPMVEDVDISPVATNIIVNDDASDTESGESQVAAAPVRQEQVEFLSSSPQAADSSEGALAISQVGITLSSTAAAATVVADAKRYIEAEFLRPGIFEAFDFSPDKAVRFRGWNPVKVYSSEDEDEVLLSQARGGESNVLHPTSSSKANGRHLERDRPPLRARPNLVRNEDITPVPRHALRRRDIGIQTLPIQRFSGPPIRQRIDATEIMADSPRLSLRHVENPKVPNYVPFEGQNQYQPAIENQDRQRYPYSYSKHYTQAPAPADSSGRPRPQMAPMYSDPVYARPQPMPKYPYAGHVLQDYGHPSDPQDITGPETHHHYTYNNYYYDTKDDDDRESALDLQELERPRDMRSRAF